jgi:hypothetical protein
MKTYPDCIPCFFRQALENSRLAGADEKTQKKILIRLIRTLSAGRFDCSPPELSRFVYGIVRKLSGNPDPFLAIKRKSNRMALSVYPLLKSKVHRARDRMLAAVELAIAGNIIDYGVAGGVNIRKALNRILLMEEKVLKHESRRLFNYAQFKRSLKKSRRILYLADNAGETVFDRVLIEEIKSADPSKEIFYAVKGHPIINDALKADAASSGISSSAKIVSTGLAVPGLALSLCSPAFLRRFRQADMVISKGLGNFEALEGARKPVFFLLMAKCPVVARHVRCRQGDVVLLFRKA